MAKHNSLLLQYPIIRRDSEADKVSIPHFIGNETKIQSETSSFLPSYTLVKLVLTPGPATSY